jgi:tetratricopeptide (TPR) repeat protein
MKRSVETRLARAMESQRAGRLTEAERLYGEALARDPESPETWHRLALVAYQQGDGRTAAARVLEAIRRQPRNAAFHCTLGEILPTGGKPAEAAMCYREALRLQPDFPAALINLGNALQCQGRYQEACVAYWHAIREHPNCAEAFNNLGNALRAQGHPGEAVSCFGEALRLEPENHDAAVNLAGALLQLNRPVEAEQWARQAVCRRRSAAALSALSVARKAQQHYREAEELAREALTRSPRAAYLHANLGAILLCRKKYEEAAGALEGALRLQPDNPDTRTSLASALAGLGRLEEASAHCETVVRSHPGFAEAWTELGLIRQQQGRHPDALVCLDEAVRIRPGLARARFAWSMALLRAGRLPEGFAEYESRWAVMSEKPRASAHPAWDGSPLASKRILLWAEQGLGDAIQFVRYAPAVAARGGCVVVEASRLLAPLFANVPGVEDVITPAMPLPDFDVQAPLLSLPRILGSTLADIPCSVPYLQADDRLVDNISQRLGPAHGLRIGIAWSGNPGHLSDAGRSVPLEKLRALGEVRGVEWFSLHIGERAHREAQRSGWVREVLSEDGGLAELAALMQWLDLVISVDSMPAHLAGALGRPVWTLLSVAADWRWLLDREDTPWYPTMRLFRQSRPRGWEEVAERVGGAVQAFVNRADKHP